MNIDFGKSEEQPGPRDHSDIVFNLLERDEHMVEDANQTTEAGRN